MTCIYSSMNTNIYSYTCISIFISLSNILFDELFLGYINSIFDNVYIYLIQGKKKLVKYLCFMISDHASLFVNVNQ